MRISDWSSDVCSSDLGIGLSIGSLIGLVTVFGISARNAILLLAHYEHLVCEEGALWNDELAWRGASERLRPVLMTALATSLGLIPLALGVGRAGHEIERSEEHTSELQSLMRISYTVFCLNKKKTTQHQQL